MKRMSFALYIICLSLSSIVSAEGVSSAIYSPNCTQEDIKEIAGGALISISKNQKWGKETKGFIITLDTEKMSFSDLAKEMQKKDCYKTQ